jgi:type IV pilus assembly protein PilV
MLRLRVHSPSIARRVYGVTMIEVLIAILVLTVGLLGVAGIQSQMQVAELEAYQRAQAIVLLQDMVNRINANRRVNATTAADYVTGSPLGTSAMDCTTAATVAAKDLCEWNNALYGSSEASGTQTLGAMIGARGCITNPVNTMPREFVVAVAWQGMRPTLSPAATTCGQGSYGSDDRMRRALVARVVIGCLQNNPTTGLCVTP